MDEPLMDDPNTDGAPSTANNVEDRSPTDGTRTRSSTVDDESEHHMCRVCRSDEGDLYYPCLCTGSIKYVHQECLVEWLKYSKKEVCELCNYKYSFQPIYRPDMPKALPVTEIVKGIASSVGRILKTWLLYTVVLIAWVGIVPLTAARIYQAVFSANIQNLLYLPLHLFNTEHLVTDCVKGIFLLSIFVCTFISLVWLREQIIHGGPQEWLQIEVEGEEGELGEGAERGRRAHRRQRRNNRGAPPEQVHPVNADGDPDAPPFDAPADVAANDAAEFIPVLDPEEEQAAPHREVSADDEHHDQLAGNENDSSTTEDEDEDSEYTIDGDEDDEDVRDPNGVHEEANGVPDDGWRDWDRLGDELTWQRLVGLDGSFVFLEHVFWVISLNTLFTVLFAFSPFKLGSWILHATGLRAKIVFFPSLAAILTGYLAVSMIVFLMHRVCRFFRIKSLFRLLGIVFLVLKVFLLVLVEIGFFPIMCGWWMDLCSLPLFHASLSSRLHSFSSSPTSSLFLHWMLGMIYVFYSASFVLLLREVLRPGVLWFMRNLNDPEFNPIMEMIELPVMRHLRRLVASTSLFFTAILLIVYLPLRIIQKALPTILPYNMSLTAETPLSELSLELLILQIVLPALLEQTSARTLLKKVVRTWCVVVGRALKLDRYLLSDNHPPQRRPDAAEPHGVNPERPEEPAEMNMEEEGFEQHVEVQPEPEVQGDDPALLAAGDLVGGGLAAEHQALLLLREPQTFEPYVRPPFFACRISILVLALGVSATFCSTVCFIVPVSLGRFFIFVVAGTRNVHELYTVGAGLYICWITSKITVVAYEWLSRGGAHLMRMIKNSLFLCGRILLAVLPPLVLIPYVIGLSFQLIVVAPVRVGLEQTPLYFPWQEWAMGVLHMKIFVAAVMMGPDWWLKAAFEQVYNRGVQRVQVGFIYREIVIPVLVGLSVQIAAPHALAHLIIAFLKPSLEDRVILLRFCYPFCLGVVAVGGFVGWQLHKLSLLAQHIRNEKYLVGTQLVNYERKGEEKTNEGDMVAEHGKAE